MAEDRSGQPAKAACPLGRLIGGVVERVAARVDVRAGRGHEVAAPDCEVGHLAQERDVGVGRGQGDAAAGALPVLVDVERDLVAVDGGDGAVEDDVEGRQVRRVVDEARCQSAASGRGVLGGTRVRGDRRAAGRRGAEVRTRGRSRGRMRRRGPDRPTGRTGGAVGAMVEVCWMSVTMCSWILADTRARLASGTSSARVGLAAPSRSIGSGPFAMLTSLLLSMRHRSCPSHQPMSGSDPDISGHRRGILGRGRPRSALGLDGGGWRPRSA